MYHLPNLLRSLSAEPLVVEPRTLHALLAVIRRKGEGASFTGAELHAETGIPDARAARGRSQSSGERQVAVIPIIGAIANRAHSFGAGADEIGSMVDRAVNDARVSAIVLDVDSPGGTVTGVPELAAKVRAARDVKPVVAVANGLMASAAYWIGSAAGEVVVSPSGEVGSIGVIMVHEDWTAALEQEGVKVTEIAAGKYKTEGAPWKELDEDARAFFEGRVAEVYDWFIRDVAANRDDTPSNVRKGYGEGRVLPGKDAIAAGLADRVGTLGDVIARLMDGRSPKRGAKMGADVPSEPSVAPRARRPMTRA